MRERADALPEWLDSEDDDHDDGFDEESKEGHLAEMEFDEEMRKIKLEKSTQAAKRGVETDPEKWKNTGLYDLAVEIQSQQPSIQGSYKNPA
jgi:hypothetical protein